MNIFLMRIRTIMVCGTQNAIFFRFSCFLYVAKYWLHQVLSEDELKSTNAAFAIIANFQDKHDSLSTQGTFFSLNSVSSCHDFDL